MPYFNKKTVLDKKSYYWLKMKTKTNIFEKDFKEVSYLQLLKFCNVISVCFN